MPDHYLEGNEFSHEGNEYSHGENEYSHEGKTYSRGGNHLNISKETKKEK